MKLNHILIILLGFLYSISSQGQNFNFDTKVSDSHQIESIKTSDFFQFYSLSPNDGIKIELTRTSIKFIIHTDDSYFVKLAKSLNLNKESDLPIQIQFENGKVINSKSPGINYVKFLKCEGDELSEAFGLSSSCEFEINIVSLYTDVSGKDVQSKNETFLALFNDNDIKSITICNNYLLSILFNKVKTSEIIKHMSDSFNKELIPNKNDIKIVEDVATLAKLVIDKPWGYLKHNIQIKSLKHFKKEIFKHAPYEKSDWYETKGSVLRKYTKAAYAIGSTNRNVRNENCWICPYVYFKKNKLVGYSYRIYLDKKLNMQTAKKIVDKLVLWLKLPNCDYYIPFDDIQKRVAFYGKYNENYVYISVPILISTFYTIEIDVTNDGNIFIH